MNSKPWQGVSEEAKDLIRQLLNENPERRLDSKEVLSHAWMALDFL
jgi:calcium-dependent protein kinase